MTKKDVNKILKRSVDYTDSCFIRETLFQDETISVEDTNIENVFYICTSNDNGLTYEYYNTIEVV